MQYGMPFVAKLLLLAGCQQQQSVTAAAADI